MTHSPYSFLLTTHYQNVQEGKQTYGYLTERHLQASWLEQKYFKNLQTVKGESIEVISPGLWNREAGPDFLKAHLKIGSQELRGDIEIHLQAKGWLHHGHHQDKRYNEVILHLFLWPSMHAQPLLKQNGEPLRAACLQDCLTVSPHDLISLIDLDLYPYKTFIGSGQCAHTLFKDLPETFITKLFTSASEWRLYQKKRYLQAHFLHVSWQIAGGIAMALGYKHNTEAFLELFKFLVNYQDQPIEILFAIGLGCCGFFEESYQLRWDHSTYYQQLKTFWWGVCSSITHQTHLKLHQIRPLNHPVRRLAYLAHFLADDPIYRLWTGIQEVWSRGRLIDRSNKKEREKLIHQFMDQIPFYEDSYWNSHYTFELESQSLKLPLMGENLKQEILVNTLFPVLYSDILERDDQEELNAFQQIYQDLKASHSSKTHYLTHRFFGDKPKGALLEKAQIEQGAYQLHKDFCIHYEASCEGCPFVERYNTFKTVFSPI